MSKMTDFTVAEIRALVSRGAVISSCAALIIDGVLVGYPADQVTPEHRGFREVYEHPEDGGDSVLVPCEYPQPN